MLPKWIHYFLLYFEFSGFGSGLTIPHSRRSKSAHFILAFHIIFGVMTTVSLIKYLVTRLTRNDVLVNDYIKICIAIIVYWCSIIELYSKREIQSQFWRQFIRIDEHFCTHRSVLLKKFLFCMTACLFGMSIYFVGFFVRIVHLIPDKMFREFWTIFGILNIIDTNRLFCYLFYVKLLAYELKVIEREVKNVTSLHQINTKTIDEIENTGMTIIYQMHFKWVREYYHLVWKMTVNLNALFAWSNFPAVLLPFQLLLADINWSIYFLIFCPSFFQKGFFIFGTIWITAEVYSKAKERLAPRFTPHLTVWILIN